MSIDKRPIPLLMKLYEKLSKCNKIEECPVGYRSEFSLISTIIIVGNISFYRYLNTQQTPNEERKKWPSSKSFTTSIRMPIWSLNILPLFLIRSRGYHFESQTVSHF
jgi:hypothetical protein